MSCTVAMVTVLYRRLSYCFTNAQNSKTLNSDVLWYQDTLDLMDRYSRNLYHAICNMHGLNESTTI